MEKRDFIKNLFVMGVAAVAMPRLYASESMSNFKSIKHNGMIKARYFEELPDGSVKCRLCPHACILRNGQSGICRTRINEGGVLYTMAYGNPVAVHIDPIEKKPLYHFLPSSKVLSFGTAGCNFRCLNCQNADISQAAPNDVSALDYSPEKVVKTAREHSVDGIAFTYTEPTVFFEYMYDTAFLAQKAGIKTLMISNGYINQEPLKDLVGVMDAFNIDLKSFNDSTYKTLCNGSLQPVLDTIKTIRDSGKWLEITNLMVTAYTDKTDEFSQMISWLIENDFTEVPLHISRFFPAHKLLDSQPTNPAVIEQAFHMATSAGMKYVYTGNIRNEAHENTQCPDCGNLLVKREGYTTKVSGMTENKCNKCGRIIPGVWIK
ncbi:MAG TPA: AmmeMemoRadiSam system radical SAM enzyme [Bacteroidales bacterium]|nr:AmmeMemoRadiSam system radical SAM enzyme [Bacteroidales bacterium]